MEASRDLNRKRHLLDLCVPPTILPLVPFHAWVSGWVRVNMPASSKLFIFPFAKHHHTTLLLCAGHHRLWPSQRGPCASQPQRGTDGRAEGGEDRQGIPTGSLLRHWLPHQVQQFVQLGDLHFGTLLDLLAFLLLGKHKHIVVMELSTPLLALGSPAEESFHCPHWVGCKSKAFPALERVTRICAISNGGANLTQPAQEWGEDPGPGQGLWRTSMCFPKSPRSESAL